MVSDPIPDHPNLILVQNVSENRGLHVCLKAEQVFFVSPPSVPELSSKAEIQAGPPAPPQMPLPEIPQPWLVSPSHQPS